LEEFGSNFQIYLKAIYARPFTLSFVKHKTPYANHRALILQYIISMGAEE